MNKIDREIYNNLELLPLDLQGWHGTSPVFEELINKTKPSLIIEVGTWKGQSAINMAKIIKKLGLSTKIYCVDTWLGALEFWDWDAGTQERNLLQKNGYPQIYYQFISNVVHNNVQDIILPFPNTSLIAARFFLNRKINSELVYVDASHDAEDVYLDIANYYKILKNKGIIFGDDYGMESVKIGVEKFCTENKINYKTHQNNHYWSICKSKNFTIF